MSMRAIARYPPEYATSTHAQAYAAACATLQRVRAMADEYKGEPLHCA